MFVIRWCSRRSLPHYWYAGKRNRSTHNGRQIPTGEETGYGEEACQCQGRTYQGWQGTARGGTLPNVVMSKFVVNIVLFVCWLLHYHHSKREETILQLFEIVYLDPFVSSERDGQVSEI